VTPQVLVDDDVFVFNNLDAFQVTNGSYIMRCNFCNDHCSPFDKALFGKKYMGFAMHHLPRCKELHTHRKIQEHPRLLVLLSTT